MVWSLEIGSYQTVDLTTLLTCTPTDPILFLISELVLRYLPTVGGATAFQR